jgi:hypothetical protein
MPYFTCLPNVVDSSSGYAANEFHAQVFKDSLLLTSLCSSFCAFSNTSIKCSNTQFCNPNVEQLFVFPAMLSGQ